MKQKLIPIALISLFLGLLFDLLFYGKLPGISVFIFSAAVLGITFYLAKLWKVSLSPTTYGLVPIILFFSLMVFVRANEFLALVNVVLVMYLLLLTTRLAQRSDARLAQYDVPHYFTAVAGLPLQFLRTSLDTLSKVINGRQRVAKSTANLAILRGVLLALPILLVFVVLLSSADLVFKKYIGSLFDVSLSPEMFVRLGLVALVAALAMGAYMLIFAPPAAAAGAKAPQKVSGFRLGVIESTIVLGSVGLLFFVFVVVQLAYFFGGAEHFASTGYTYAEYARKGFFELITVAAITLLLIWAVKRYSLSKDLRHAVLFKYLSGLLVLEVLVIMLSAHLRLNLYEEAYGFTTLRLLSHLFIGWLAVAFALLLVYIVRQEKENQFAFRLFLSVIAFFALINVINPDAFIARQNINRYNQTGKLDLYYLRELSEDATPTIGKLLHHKNERLQKGAAFVLYHQAQSFKEKSADWQSANLARQRAQHVIRDNATQIDEGKLYHIDYHEFNDTFYGTRPAD